MNGILLKAKTEVRNIMSVKSEDNTQKPQRNSTFMDLASVMRI
jgi:hypothetical protein